MLGFLTLFAVFATCITSEDAVLEERAYDPDPYEVGATDQAVFDSEPITLNAKAMSKLMLNQDAVTTCRYMLFKTFKDFYSAKEACNSYIWPITNNGIGMAKVQNEYENDDIKTLLKLAYGVKQVGKPFNRKNWVWIGLSKRRDNDRKLNDDEKGIFNNDDWQYSSGELARFSKWHAGMPDQQWSKKYKEYQTWIQINKRGYWDDTYASIEAPYACEYCGKYIVLSAHVKWEKAKRSCLNFGLEMAKVNSKADNDELAWAAEMVLGKEVDEHRWNDTNWIWIGTEEVLDPNGHGTNVWQHWDNSTLDWEPDWDKKKQPDNWVTPRKGAQDKVAFSRINNKWDDSFNKRERPFACQCRRSCTYA